MMDFQAGFSKQLFIGKGSPKPLIAAHAAAGHFLFLLR